VIHCFRLDATGLHGEAVPGGGVVPDDAIWIDLREPTADEESRIEQFLRIDVPTREEMREIETSNRFYQEGDALYMTATVVTKLDTARPENSQITFILTPDRLITNRYVDPLPFRRFIAYADRHPAQCATAAAVLAGLLEAMVNRIADVLERTGDEMDGLSADVFSPTANNGRRRDRDYRAILERVGRNGDLNSKARETLGSLARLVGFLQQANGPRLDDEVRGRLQSVLRDAEQLSNHAAFMSNKVQFLLDATLGMINIDQNNILKIFSVATVVLLPPSVIGAIFGMNFDVIPTSHADWGFWGALGLMATSAIVPFAYFKQRGWL
jgi:magnesium transporter